MAAIGLQGLEMTHVRTMQRTDFCPNKIIVRLNTGTYVTWYILVNVSYQKQHNAAWSHAMIMYCPSTSCNYKDDKLHTTSGYERLSVNGCRLSSRGDGFGFNTQNRTMRELTQNADGPIPCIMSGIMSRINSVFNPRYF